MAFSAVLGQQWLWGDTSVLWLLLPAIAFIGGALALALGINAWKEPARTPGADGSQRAQLGMILGGVALGCMILVIVALIVFLVLLVIALGNGID